MTIYETRISGIKDGQQVKRNILSDIILSIEEIKKNEKEIGFLEIHSMKKYEAVIVLTDSEEKKIFSARVTSNKKIKTLLIEEESMGKALKRILSISSSIERLGIHELKESKLLINKTK